MTDNITRLKKALEAGPTEGPWFRNERLNGPFWHISSNHTVGGKSCLSGKQAIASVHGESKRGAVAYAAMFEANANFIAAANPAAIRELLERLEQAEKDARRYRWLRRSGSARLDEERADLVNAYGDHYLDQAIDAAIAAQEEGRDA